MKAPDRRLLPLLLFLTLVLTLGTSGWGDLYNETDGQYGGAARVMAEGGSWLVPENNGSPRLVKPPLLYWLMAASMKVFGITEFAARLPGALALTAWVGVTYLFGARWGGPWRGFLAGGILLGSLGTFTLGRIVMPEPLFSAFIAAALYCVLRGREDAVRRARWFAGFWLCAALASFTKGWHGVLYPLLIVAAAAVLSRDSRPGLRGLLSGTGLAIFAVINLPWYLYIESQFPGWLHNLVFAEQIAHITGSSTPATDYTSVPRGQFLLLHLAWFFPWSVVLLICGRPTPGVWTAMRTRVLSFPAALVVAWLLVVLVSVLLAGQRQDYYAMTLWPAFALLAAAALEGRPLQKAAVALTILLGLGFAVAVVLPAFESQAETAAVADRATAWTTVTRFDTSVWHSLRTTAFFALGGAALCGLAAVRLRERRQFLALVGASVCLALGAVSGTSVVSPYFSLARAAPVLIRTAKPDTRLVYDGGIDTGSSLLFYTRLPVTLLNQNPDEDFIIRRFDRARDRFLDTAEFLTLWQSGHPVLFITESAKLLEWEAQFGRPLVPLTRCGTQVVLQN